jgi:hypothetical protein
MLSACAISRRQSRGASYNRGSSPARRFRGAPAPTAIVVPTPANATAVSGMVRLAGCPIGAAPPALQPPPVPRQHGKPTVGPLPWHRSQSAFRAGILHRQSRSKRTRRRGEAKGKKRIDLLLSAPLRLCASSFSPALRLAIAMSLAAGWRQPTGLCRCMGYDPIGIRRVASCPADAMISKPASDLRFSNFGVKQAFQEVNFPFQPHFSI